MTATPRRLAWWIAVPAGLALGLALALGLDGAAAPAGAQAGGSGITLSAEQLRINQRIAQQGVRRANRANARLDALRPAAAGPQGPPGPAGPAGPGATRIAYSAAAGSPARPVLDLAGVLLQVECQAGGGGETTLAISAVVSAPTTLVGTSSTDDGDPGTPVEVGNFQVALAPGPPNPLGGPSATGDATTRSVADVLFLGPTRTVGIDVAAVADDATATCSFDGVAVPAG